MPPQGRDRPGQAQFRLKFLFRIMSLRDPGGKGQADQASIAGAPACPAGKAAVKLLLFL